MRRKTHEPKVIKKIIKPQDGFQQAFLSCTADIAIGGGAAGAGKSFAELLEPLYHKDNPKFNTVIFRKTLVQVTNPGGLWDESNNIYPEFKAKSNQQRMSWTFPSGAVVKFSHLEHERNVYDHQGAQYNLIIFDELTHFCLTPETEVLTEYGWKKITEVRIGENVASLSANEQIEYKPVTDLHEFDFEGNLRCISQRNGVSFRATPNHQAMVMKQKQFKDKRRGEEYQGWKFREVSKLKGCIIPRSGNYEGGEEIEFYHFKWPTARGHGRNSNSIQKVKMDIWLEYLGWFLAEGSCFTSNNRTKSPIVTLRQTKLKNHEELCELHKALGFRWKYRQDGNYMIFSRQLFDVLKPMGNRYQKRVPEWVFKLSKRQQKIFLDAFVKGDGYITPTGGTTLGLCNSGLIDDLQRIAFHLGLVATTGFNHTKTGFDVYRLHICTSSKYNKVRSSQWYDEHYNGKVHCLTVQDNHNFYIRHNGRCCWTGNSKKSFFYLLSRNRSVSGIKPYMRATCNPDPESFVAELIEWWIDQEELLPSGEKNPRYGYPIPERAGKIRYFMVDKETYVWGDTKQEVINKCPHIFSNPEFAGLDHNEMIKSFTFIPGTIYGNKELLKKNPAYLSNLMAQDDDERLRLMEGNWKIKIDPLCLFNGMSIEGMFTNMYPSNTNQRYITCDAAGLGTDMCTIFVWYGWKVVHLEVMTTSMPQEVVDRIEDLRTTFDIIKGRVLIDQDGVGGGVVKLGRYQGFSGGDQPFEDPSIRKKEWYQNLKTQCYYRFAERVNNDEVALPLSNENVRVDGLTGVKVKWKGKIYDVRQLIKQDLRAIKQRDRDHEGKKRINDKADQKLLLGGRSPDFGDGLMMRVYFEFRSGELKTGNATGSLLDKL